MRLNNNELIELCENVINKNRIFSAMLTDKDYKIRRLERINKELVKMVILKDRDISKLNADVHNLNQDMLDMAYKITRQGISYA